MPSIFAFYRDSPPRRAALRAPLGAPERYALFGLDELRARGIPMEHSLEPEGPPPIWARRAGALTKSVLERAGGYGGDFASVFASLRRANRADVVLSTVDTVGVPLVLASRAGLLRRPLVYVAVGLPERLERLRGRRIRDLYADALGRTSAVVTYSQHEASAIGGWVESRGHSARVEFIPFGVDVTAIVPSAEAPVDDVVAVGADPHRDFELLFAVARARPQSSFRIVATRDRAGSFEGVPENVTVDADVPFDEMLGRIRRARAVALPVQDNSYSGATTVLLQAMALAKPVVVSATKAIIEGYSLVDGDNCRLVPPGDAEAFGRALADVLRDEWRGRALGARGRQTVECELSWSAYVDRMETVLREAAERE